MTEFLDDLFCGCALAAFVERACVERNWPDPESTRRLAYRLYEEALAEKNRRPAVPVTGSQMQLVPSEVASGSHD